jgi:hypothetical protein
MSALPHKAYIRASGCHVCFQAAVGNSFAVNVDRRKRVSSGKRDAGTSVDQIERFYARNLPLSKEMAEPTEFGGE